MGVCITWTVANLHLAGAKCSKFEFMRLFVCIWLGLFVFVCAVCTRLSRSEATTITRIDLGGWEGGANGRNMCLNDPITILGMCYVQFLQNLAKTEFLCKMGVGKYLKTGEKSTKIQFWARCKLTITHNHVILSFITPILVCISSLVSVRCVLGAWQSFEVCTCLVTKLRVS